MKSILTTIFLILLVTPAMAYEIYISKGDQFSKHFKPIQLEEWEKIIKQKNELQKIEFIEVENLKTKEVIKLSMPNSAKYTVVQKKLFKKIKKVFYLTHQENGVISTQYTKDKDLNHIKKLAIWFSAEIYGEEGEKY